MHKDDRGCTRLSLRERRRALSEPVSDDERDALRKVALVAHRHMPGSLLGGLLIAGAMALLVEGFPVLLWVAAFLACAMLARWVATPFRSDKPEPTHRDMLVMAAGTMASTIVVGLAGFYGLQGDTLARSVALLILAGGIIVSYVTFKSCPELVLTSCGPLALCLIAAPVSDLLAGDLNRLNIGSTVSAVLFALSLIPLWKSSLETEREESRYRHALDNRRLQAESATAAKSAFIATVSHELRTPISAILAGSADLERLDTSTAVQMNARLIQNAGRMMRTLLNDLLDLAKLEAGRMSIEDIPYDFRMVIADQMRFWRSEARNRGVRLRLRGSATAPSHIMGDPTRLRQVLNNLLSNALKFTDDGSITLQLHPPARRGGVQEIRIDVIDTGCGMDAEQMARLFTPFDQGGASVSRTHGGTGLGLSISREIARLMGGDVTVRSELGRGSVFTVVFHAELAESAARVEAPQRTPPLNLAGKLEVMVVDDHEINRRAMALILGPLDVNLTMAASGDEALELLAVMPFDVVLMDVHMPGINGHETTRQLRARPGPNRHVPVIAVTGAVDEAALRACRDAGMDDQVAKPIDAGELFSALARHTATDQATSSDELRADLGSAGRR